METIVKSLLEEILEVYEATVHAGGPTDSLYVPAAMWLDEANAGFSCRIYPKCISNDIVVLDDGTLRIRGMKVYSYHGSDIVIE